MTDELKAKIIQLVRDYEACKDVAGMTLGAWLVRNIGREEGTILCDALRGQVIANNLTDSTLPASLTLLGELNEALL